MKRILGIAITAVAALGTFSGCGDKEDIFTSQQTAIERYLTSSRRLINETEIGDIIEDNPAFYTQIGRSVYRHIPNYYDASRDTTLVIERGDSVRLRFDAYVFSGSEPSTSDVYWSNISTTINSLTSSGGNSLAQLDWSTEPLAVKVGSTNMIGGLERGLIGCCAQDSVQIYMTYDMAYGKRLVGTVPKNSSVAWYIKILNVTK